MSLVFRHIIAVWTVIVLVGGPCLSDAAPTGFLEGHLRIFSLKEVELENGNGTTKTTAENYAEYPLIVLGKNNGKEVTRVTADSNGNYRVALPAGDYVLDVRRGANGRPLGHLRAEPHSFTILPNQTVRVDMDIDTGIR